MYSQRLLIGLVCVLCLLRGVQPASAQTDRRESPRLLAEGTAELNIGHIDYPFSQAQLEPGHTAGEIDVPNLGVRVSIGRRISERLSAQLLYLRPARWIHYRNINGDESSRSVWMNVMGVTVQARRSLLDRVSVYGEGGLGIVTRHGFEIDQRAVLDDAVYVTPLLGAGIEYRWSQPFGLKAGLTFVPGRASAAQPRTLFFSGGVTYQVDGGRNNRRPEAGSAEQVFPEHLVQVGYTTSALGYGFNTMMAPVFWQGDAEVGSGLTIHYQRNVFHTEKQFSIDWGVGLAYGRSRRDRDGFVAVSAYPLFRWTALRTEPVDLYFSYSLAGPTLLSRYVLDGEDTGRHFTFQDLLGIGIYAGRDRHLNTEIRIGHYSNGNLLPRNAGIKVPMTINIGYAF